MDQQLQDKERQKASESRWKLKKFVSRTDGKLDNVGVWQVKRDERQASTRTYPLLTLRGKLTIVLGERRQQLLDSISKHDHLTPFKQSRRKTHPRTAEWLFETSEFKKWFTGEASQVLWTSGKSMILLPRLII